MRHLAIGLFGIVLALPLRAAAEGEWFYGDLLGRTQLIFSREYIESHSRTPLTLCATSSPFHCIESPGFQFAYPKRRAGEKSWTWNGAVYTITAEEERGIAGRAYRVMYIDQAIDGTRRMRFLFSEERGLLAFSAIAEGPTPVFFLENTCGFGASKCREPKNPSRK